VNAAAKQRSAQEETMLKEYRVITYCWMALVLLACSTASLAQTTQGISSVPYQSIPPQEESTIERTAVVVLRHIAQSRADIHRKSWGSARRELEEAARLMDSIREELSTAVAKNLIRITRKHLEYEASQRVVHELPPIFEALDKIEVYIPTDKARRHLERARVYLEKDDKKRAVRELVLADGSLLEIDVELPVLRAEKFVTRALGYLATKNGQKADKALLMAEQVIRIITVGTESPFSQARENVWLAFQNYSTARLPEAKSYMEKAKGHLEKARQVGNARGREEAGKLSAEVTELEKKLDSGVQEVGLALKSVEERSKALAERSVEYLAADWREAEKTYSGERNLIEAKLHVAYAETYQLTAAEPDKAAKELDEAHSYLLQAMKNRATDKPAREKIGEIDRAVLTLKANPGRNELSVQDSYENIKEKLSDRIEVEHLSDLAQELGR
jgi:YfdX protein